ncbi:hypothetical protein [Caldisericum exile]|uniref:DUF4870 domain-containing protein n=1 Tax=Caldisericum exile (strain DSM 21853 / NBRC 104410 / AZM16c01) TaxID=511051 RepID=A0A7U6GDU5_CALEA|nr:hypothetical protein [Caldisericum exile]BAL80580.1 hypothetical protein CSE_04540 [Caldisericum exile AZM16c01]
MEKFDIEDINKNRYVAAISYVSILFILPLLLVKDSPFVKEHTKQGFVLFLFEILGSIIYYFPIYGRVLGGVILVICLIISVVGFLVALTGGFIEFPVIYDLTREIKI